MGLISIFQNFIAGGATTLSIALSSVFPLSHHVSSPPTNIQSTGTQNMIVINKTVNTMGKQITLSLSLPKEGGPITGTVSGDCQGTIAGNYSGKPQNDFTGNSTITCPLGFMSIQADATFTGIVHPEQHVADVTYTVTGSGFSKTGNTTVSYSE